MTGIDHAVVAVPDLEDATARLAAAGIVCRPGGAHPIHGTVNALAGLDAGRYLEVLAADPTVPDDERSARGRLVAAVSRPTFIEVLLREPVASTLAVLRAEYDVDEPLPGHRVRPDGTTVRWALTRWRIRGGSNLPDLVGWRSHHPGSSLEASGNIIDVVLVRPDASATARALKAVGAQDVRVRTSGVQALHIRSAGGAAVVFEGGWSDEVSDRDGDRHLPAT